MARVPCQLADIYEATKRALVSAGIVTESQAFISLMPDDIKGQPPVPPLNVLSFREYDQFPTTLSCEDTTETATTVQGELTITLWTRMAIDPQGSEDAWLTDRTRGVSELLRQFKAVFDNGVLTNEDDDEITWRQLIFLGYRNYGRGKDPEWRRVDFRLDCCYEWDPNPAGMAEFPLIYGATNEVLSYDDAGSLLVWR